MLPLERPIHMSFDAFQRAVLPVQQLLRIPMHPEAFLKHLYKRHGSRFAIEVAGEGKSLDLFTAHGDLFDCTPENRRSWDLATLFDAYKGDPVLDNEGEGIKAPYFVDRRTHKGYSRRQTTAIVRSAIHELTEAVQFGCTHLLGHAEPVFPDFFSDVIAVRVTTGPARTRRADHTARVLNISTRRRSSTPPVGSGTAAKGV